MARTVDEIMNREVFSVRARDTIEKVIDGILSFGITGAPVIDEERRPIGMVSLRELLEREGPTVAWRMTSPAPAVGQNVSIREAAELLARTGYHRLVVIDGAGRVSGMVSAIDVLRGLTGIPTAHPSSFPHFDETTGLFWTDDLPLELESLDSAPSGPGVLVLIHGLEKAPETLVWSEDVDDVRDRLVDLLAVPQEDPVLRGLLLHGHLRFRAASCDDPARRERALAAVRARVRSVTGLAGV